MKILLCVILLAAALLLFAVWPGKRRDELRLPFYGRNYAHRGLFGKDQCPPENSLPAFAAAASSWMSSLHRTIGWLFFTMIRWTV